MKIYILAGLTLLIAIGWIIDRSGDEILAVAERYEGNSPSVQRVAIQKKWEAFEVSDLMKKQKVSSRSYLPFLKRPSLHMGPYSLPISATDNQRPHKEDEVYYIESGKATIRIGSENRKVKKGSIVYVEREVPHHFHSIEEPLSVVVFFSSCAPKQ